MAPDLSIVSITDEPESTSGELAEQDDEESMLIDRAVAGDENAFSELYERYVDRVYRHAYYYLGSRADAEDVTQQTFLRAWQAIGRYRRSGAPIVAWLLTIAGRTAISQIRQAREFPGDVTQPNEAGGNDPQDIVAVLNACGTVRDAVSRLSRDRQQIIVLRFIEGLSIAEVAAALGKSENNVSVIQHRALGDLRRLLDARPSAREPRSRVVQTLRNVIVRAAGSA